MQVSLAAQRRLKRSVVSEALSRSGASPSVVRAGPELPAFGYRTTLRMAATRRSSPGPGPGRLGFRKSRAHEVVGLDSCLVAHPDLASLVAEGDFGEATEVVLRCGARTGERLAVLSPGSSGCHLPESVRVIGADELAQGRRAWIFEQVAGARLRVSARSFFQASPEGAEALAGLAEEALADAPAGPLVDAYGGVGLFGRTLGQDRAVTVLETSPSSAADARVNLPSARVRQTDVARWRPKPAAVVVADPPRTGLGRGAVACLAATGASHLVLVSCDVASLARDAALLGAKGFRLEATTVVDMFPGTPHIETVSRFVR
jgi:23S rRNA (uracil1939-C5)-methyltransferase